MDKVRQKHIRRYFLRSDDSKFYLEILDANTDNIDIHFMAHEDPELVKEEIARIRNENKGEVQYRFNGFHVNLENHTSALVVNISRIVRLAQGKL